MIATWDWRLRGSSPGWLWLSMFGVMKTPCSLGLDSLWIRGEEYDERAYEAGLLTAHCQNEIKLFM